MSRGMKGCYVWSVDEETNAWLQEAAGRAFLGSLGPEAVEADEELPFRVSSDEEAAGSDRAVPLYEMAVAAGVPKREQVVEEPTWIELPEAPQGGEGLFVVPGGWGVDEPEGAEWVVVLVPGAAGGDPGGEGGVGC